MLPRRIQIVTGDCHQPNRNPKCHLILHPVHRHNGSQPKSCISLILWFFGERNQSLAVQIDLQSLTNLAVPLSMNDFLDSDSQRVPLSPNAFIADLESPHLHPLEEEPPLRDRCSIDEGTFGSEKSTKKKLAGAKSREKKKRHLETLEESVRVLTAQIENCDSSISQCKDQLVEALRMAASTASEHSFTYAQLQRATLSGEGDLDRVNLLLDMIQNRIGANASERQARLDYNFKQIINSLFPALHRYLMHAARHKLDIFAPIGEENNNAWTVSFYEEVGLSAAQREAIGRWEQAMAEKRRETVGVIGRLKSSKEGLKRQQQIFERAMTHFREQMNPLQSARLILFGERNKLRKQFSLFCDEFAYQESAKMVKTD